MANARVTYTGDGSATSYTVSFPFINRTHVVVTVNGVTQTLTTHYVWLNDSTIQFVTAPPSSQAVVFRRYTPIASRLVDFHDAAILTEADLDLDSVQHLYLAQERADEQEALTASTVQSVTGTAPIVSSGGATPAVSITAATTSAAGSMSAADKVKIDATSGTNTGDQTNITGNAGTVTTNANLTGIVTSSGNATAIADGAIAVAKLTGTLPVANGGTGVTASTGSGSTVLNTSATLVTPALGTPSALVGTNITGTGASFTSGATNTNANLTGHVTSVGNASTLNSFTSTELRGAITDETGTGVAVFGTSPTLITPVLGTPASGNLANCTSLLLISQQLVMQTQLR